MSDSISESKHISRNVELEWGLRAEQNATLCRVYYSTDTVESGQ